MEHRRPHYFSCRAKCSEARTVLFRKDAVQSVSCMLAKTQHTSKLRRKGTMTEECTINVYLLSLSWKRQQIKTMGWKEGKMKIKSYKHKQTQTSRQSQSFQLRRSKNLEVSSRSTERGSTFRSSTELLHVSLPSSTLSSQNTHPYHSTVICPSNATSIATSTVPFSESKQVLPKILPGAHSNLE